MATVIPFEERAIARLRERLGAAEDANQDLIAFARGHSGAAASIHEAVLAAVETAEIDELLHVVTQEWPLIMRIDSVAIALNVGGQGFIADGSGVQRVEPRMIDRAAGQIDGVTMRAVKRGHPLFGPAASLIRAEALIEVDCGPGFPRGLLVLGQRGALDLEGRHGSELLLFLGQSIAAMIRRWLRTPTD